MVNAVKDEIKDINYFSFFLIPVCCVESVASLLLLTFFTLHNTPCLYIEVYKISFKLIFHSSAVISPTTFLSKINWPSIATGNMLSYFKFFLYLLYNELYTKTICQSLNGINALWIKLILYLANQLNKIFYYLVHFT